jgi:class 3 adenylate cyclase
VVFASSILENIKRIGARVGLDLNVRIAVHTGNITASVVGSSLPRYLIFGSDCEVVRMMEAKATAGLLEISDATAKLLPKEWMLTPQEHMLSIGECVVRTYVVHMSPVNHKLMIRARKMFKNYPQQIS